MVAENPSIVVARDIVSSLISSGVRHVAYCPGSRDAPFAYALAAAERARVVNVATFSEERGAGFWAVGAAKAGVGAAVITTSGTAAAELHPALEEAYFQGLPIVVVTADRPHEMRGVGASQTTHQDGIFGSSVVYSDSLPAFELIPDSTRISFRNRVARLVSAANGFMGQPGPGHLNVAFRDPLVPAKPVLPVKPAAPCKHEASLRDNTISLCDSSTEGDNAHVGNRVPEADGDFRADELARQRGNLVPVEDGVTHNRGYMASSQVAGLPTIEIAEKLLPAWDSVVLRGLRTVVVAGDGADRSVAEMASARGIPVLAEPSSGVTGCETWIPYQQWLVSTLGAQVQQVIVTGRPTLSRPVSTLLSRPEIRKIIVATHREWVDVAGTATIVVEGLADEPELSSPSNNEAPFSSSETLKTARLSRDSALAQTAKDWLRRWQEAARQVEQRVFDETTYAADTAASEGIRTEGSNGVLSGGPVVDSSLSLLSACRANWHESAESLLRLGASNTIRGFDLAANAPGRGDVYSNRGLAGIDGTVASALGLAMASRKPVRAVMGDMTFAYDLATLAQRPEGLKPEAPGVGPDIQVVVLDDGGGSIFASLEHGAAPQELYDRFFGVKPHLDAVAAAKAAGWDGCSISTLKELREKLRVPIRGRSMLRVTIPWPADEIAAARAVAEEAVAARAGGE